MTNAGRAGIGPCSSPATGQASLGGAPGCCPASVGWRLSARGCRPWLSTPTPVQSIVQRIGTEFSVAITGGALAQGSPTSPDIAARAPRPPRVSQGVAPLRVPLRCLNRRQRLERSNGFDLDFAGRRQLGVGVAFGRHIVLGGGGEGGDLLGAWLDDCIELRKREPGLLGQAVDPARDRLVRAVVEHRRSTDRRRSRRSTPRGSISGDPPRQPPLSATRAMGGPERVSQTASSGSSLVEPRSQRIRTAHLSGSSASSRADFHARPRFSARAADHPTRTPCAIVVVAGGALTARTPPRPVRSMPRLVSRAIEPSPQTHGALPSQPAASSFATCRRTTRSSRSSPAWHRWQRHDSQPSDEPPHPQRPRTRSRLPAHHDPPAEDPDPWLPSAPPARTDNPRSRLAADYPNEYVEGG